MPSAWLPPFSIRRESSSVRSVCIILPLTSLSTLWTAPFLQKPASYPFCASATLFTFLASPSHRSNRSSSSKPSSLPFSPFQPMRSPPRHAPFPFSTLDPLHQSPPSLLPPPAPSSQGRSPRRLLRPRLLPPAYPHHHFPPPHQVQRQRPPVPPAGRSADALHAPPPPLPDRPAAADHAMGGRGQPHPRVSHHPAHTAQEDALLAVRTVASRPPCLHPRVVPAAAHAAVARPDGGGVAPRKRSIGHLF